MRVMSVVGARPQFVKAAPVSQALALAHSEVLVHTGQHYDDAMSASFFRDLEMREPDVNLEVGSAPHGAQTAEMLAGLERAMAEHRPDGVLVYGDTNSTLAAAVAAAKVSYPDGGRPWLAHVEAGLRSHNRVMAEERNRVVADHLSDLLLAPTSGAMAHLAREGLGDRAELVGDVMVDAFCRMAEGADRHLPDAARDNPGYVLVTLHRAENVDDADQFARLLRALEVGRPVLFPVHPRTRNAISAAGHMTPGNVILLEPVGYPAMVALETHAAAIATDSGGVQKEAYLAGTPCITLRTETEWVETVDAGWNRVVGDAPERLSAILADEGFMARDRPRPDLYGDAHAASRIVAAIERFQENRR